MKQKSVAWLYFSRSGQNSSASCVFCGQTFKVPTSGTTTNLINHLRDKHRSSLVENHPHMIPVLPDADRSATHYHDSYSEPAPSSERNSPFFNEELIKPEPIDEIYNVQAEIVQQADSGSEKVIKNGAEQEAERPGTSENSHLNPPVLKRIKLMKETPSSSTPNSPKSDEYKILGNFVSSELQSASEIDPTLAMKASIAIQEALLNLKKDLMFGNKA